MQVQKLPNLIIAGANRAGTTSLYTYLSMNPDVCASSIKEVNYFTPLIYGRKLAPIEEYTSYFKHCRGESKYLMEASPRYLFGGDRIAKAIYEKLGQIRLIFMLRDPADRCLSYYRQRKAAGEITKEISFRDYVQRALSDLADIGRSMPIEQVKIYETNVYVRGVAEGFYSTHLRHWRAIFGDSIGVYFLEDLKRDPSRFMSKVCRWLGIECDIYTGATFLPENRSVAFKSYRLAALANAVNHRFERFFRRHHSLKKFLRSLFYLLNEQSTPQPTHVQELRDLRELYRPFNKELFDLLSSWSHGTFPRWLTNGL